MAVPSCAHSICCICWRFKDNSQVKSDFPEGGRAGEVDGVLSERGLIKITWRTTVCDSGLGGHAPPVPPQCRVCRHSPSIHGESFQNKVNVRGAVGDVNAPCLGRAAAVDSQRSDLGETLKQSYWFFWVLLFFLVVLMDVLVLFGRLSALPPQQHAEFSCRAGSV